MRRNTLFMMLVLISLALISLAALRGPNLCLDERGTSVENCFSKNPAFIARQ